jgi:selenoprotein W-related protein
LTDEVLEGWGPRIESLELVPTSGGVFEVTLDGELVFSKRSLGRHAEDGEIAALLRERLGPEVPRG